MDSRYISLYDLLQNKIFLNDELMALINNDKLKAYNPNGVPIKIFNFSFTNKQYNNHYVCMLKLSDAICSMSTQYPDILYPDENTNSSDDLRYKEDDCVVQYHNGKDIYILKEEIQKLKETMENNLNNKLDIEKNETLAKETLQLDESSCNPRSKKTLFKFIMGLGDLYHINFAEPGLATSLEVATEVRECKLPRSTADKLLEDIFKFISEYPKESAN